MGVWACKPLVRSVAELRTRFGIRCGRANRATGGSRRVKELEADFRAASRGGCWEGQVGAIDGVHFAMRAPSKKDVPDPMKYFVAGKDEYAILCIAVCDAHRRFTSYDISKSATTHDSSALLCVMPTGATHVMTFARQPPLMIPWRERRVT